MRRRGQEVTVDPVEQVRTNHYAIRHYVESDPRWRDSSRSRIRWAHGIVLPHSELDDDFAKPDCPRWMICGRGDLGDLAGRVRDIPLQQETDLRVPDQADSPWSSRSSRVGCCRASISPRRRTTGRRPPTG